MIYIFDFDGVIKDSVSVKGEAFRELYADYGETIANDIFLDHLRNGGMPRLEKFRRWEMMFFDQELSPEKEVELLNKFEAIVVNRVIESKYIEGFETYYSGLNPEDCYVCTASPQEEARLIIKSLNLEFNGIFGYPKTKEEIIKEIKSITEADTDYLYFGDSDKDLVACVNCDIPFVPINYSGKLLHIDRFSFKDIYG